MMQAVRLRGLAAVWARQWSGSACASDKSLKLSNDSKYRGETGLNAGERRWPIRLWYLVSAMVHTTAAQGRIQDFSLGQMSIVKDGAKWLVWRLSYTGFGLVELGSGRQWGHRKNLCVVRNEEPEAVFFYKIVILTYFLALFKDFFTVYIETILRITLHAGQF